MYLWCLRPWVRQRPGFETDGRANLRKSTYEALKDKKGSEVITKTRSEYKIEKHMDRFAKKS